MYNGSAVHRNQTSNLWVKKIKVWNCNTLLNTLDDKAWGTPIGRDGILDSTVHHTHTKIYSLPLRHFSGIFSIPGLDLWCNVNINKTRLTYKLQQSSTRNTQEKRTPMKVFTEVNRVHDLKKIKNKNTWSSDTREINFAYYMWNFW